LKNVAQVLKLHSNDGLPKLPFKAEINRARLAVTCGECGKGRLLFAERKLSVEEADQLKEAILDQPYVCGTVLFNGS
jgi:hypothetical protein